ncbi:DUF2934 domain-containing protein [Aurantimonas sp. VKM B-3413]|uniref:DUF2934 domain-containing protein n=1 Tax=Aurantimonas sp. VKM B-3413 TaxID=2779401 RepID=UPI001E621ACA|nr:DUF2934 domain-containing protein [Aurantimonas sp. VKM B-3413]MCB8838214.1 DUF2934 domain-containing protein [Aurantimonas sp. VKM B-3413]
MGGTMVKIDDAEAVRKLAYEIWEREGCPSGREHEHWAEANRIHASRMPREPQQPIAATVAWDRREAERQEIDLLRRALWTPEPFSADLYAEEAVNARRLANSWRRRTGFPGQAAIGQGANVSNMLPRTGTGR